MEPNAKLDASENCRYLKSMGGEALRYLRFTVLVVVGLEINNAVQSRS
jgi:hypothetical protein